MLQLQRRNETKLIFLCNLIFFPFLLHNVHNQHQHFSISFGETRRFFAFFASKSLNQRKSGQNCPTIMYTHPGPKHFDLHWEAFEISNWVAASNPRALIDISALAQRSKFNCEKSWAHLWVTSLELAIQSRLDTLVGGSVTLVQLIGGSLC